MKNLEIRTLWRTATQQCELVWSQFNGYRVRLWIHGRLILEEIVADGHSGVDRGRQLRTEWAPQVE